MADTWKLTKKRKVRGRSLFALYAYNDWRDWAVQLCSQNHKKRYVRAVTFGRIIQSTDGKTTHWWGTMLPRRSTKSPLEPGFTNYGQGPIKSRFLGHFLKGRK